MQERSSISVSAALHGSNASGTEPVAVAYSRMTFATPTIDARGVVVGTTFVCYDAVQARICWPSRRPWYTAAVGSFVGSPESRSSSTDRVSPASFRIVGRVPEGGRLTGRLGRSKGISLHVVRDVRSAP